MRHNTAYNPKVEHDLRTRGIGGNEQRLTFRKSYFDTKPRYNTTSNGSVLVKLFAIFFALLLFTNLVAVLRGDTNSNLFSFKQLIESIGNAPLIDLKDIDLTSNLVDENWGALDFIRVALVGLGDTWFGEFINLLVFLGAGLANAFIFITYFLRLFFAL